MLWQSLSVPGKNKMLHLSNVLLLQSLLDDFVQHNVDTACALLESAGRFLYRLPETHTRMANMAEVRLVMSRHHQSVHIMV